MRYRSSGWVITLMLGALLFLSAGCGGGTASPVDSTATIPQSAATAVPPTPTPVRVELVSLDNPVAGFSISYPQGWVYIADVEQSYFAENDRVLQSADPRDGALLVISSMPLSRLAQDSGAELGVDDVFAAVANNLISTRRAVIGETAPRQFGSQEGVGGQVMWVDARTGARIQGYLAAVIVEDAAVVVLGLAKDTAWNATWSIFDVMLSDLRLSAAQPPGDAARGDIALGERSQAELTAGWADHWTFTSAGQEYVRVSAQAVAQRWDPYLEVYGPMGQLMADDDDGGEGVDAHLGALWLASSGTYTIYVSGFVGAGLYDIALERVEPAGGPISHGQTVVEELTAPTEWHVWTFDGEADEAIDIAMKAEQSDVDGILDLFNPDGYLVAFNAAATGPEALIAGYVLPQGGRYRIVARTANDTVGPYQLSLKRLESVGGGSISYGQPVTGTILPQEEQQWVFEGDEGDLLTLSMEALAGDLDSRLTLLSPDGTELAMDDNSGRGRGALVEGYSLPLQGIYTVRAAAGPGVAGSYRLHVGPTVLEGTLAYGDTVTGTVEPGARDNWLFEGQAGDRVTIVVIGQSEELDGYLELYALDATQLAVDDDSAGGSDPQITAFVLPESGVYRVAVNDYTEEHTGDYELTLTKE